MTEHEKLVEQVARAISDRLGHDWSEAGQGVKEICEECATAAIAAVHAALQEPSEGMIYAGIDEDQSDDVYRDVAGIYRVMLAASPLKEVEG